MDVVGRVIGTEDATPLEFWVGVGEGAYLQLDDVVALDRMLPDGELVRVYGVVSQYELGTTACASTVTSSSWPTASSRRR